MSLWQTPIRVEEPSVGIALLPIPSPIYHAAIVRPLQAVQPGLSRQIRVPECLHQTQGVTPLPAMPVQRRRSDHPPRFVLWALSPQSL